MRYAASPSAAAEFFRMLLDTDITDVLPTIRVPTLVLYRAKRAGAACRVAELIPRSNGDAGRRLRTSRSGRARTCARRSSAFSAAARSCRSRTVCSTTVLFTDIVGSTERAAALGDRAWRDLLASHHAPFATSSRVSAARSIDTAGDGFFATFDGPARAIRCAQAIVDARRELGLEHARRAAHRRVRAARRQARRASPSPSAPASAAEAEPGEVLVSGTVKDLVAGSGIAFEERGVRELKGLPGEWPLYAVRENYGFAAVPEVVWQPTDEVLERANVVRFMRRHGFDDYRALSASLAGRSRVVLAGGRSRISGSSSRTRGSRSCDLSRGPEWATWFVGGRLNIAGTASTAGRARARRPDGRRLARRGRRARGAHLRRALATR